MGNQGIVSACVGLGLLGCGGGSASNPLISGVVSGNYGPETFTLTTGFATVYTPEQGDPRNLIGVGTDLGCDSPNMNEPPDGSSAVIAVPSFDPGTYGNVFVNLYQNIDEFSGIGSNSGTVTITSSSATSVAATVSFGYTDATSGEMYALAGTFEVVRCE
jgi:hypothetical protein